MNHPVPSQPTDTVTRPETLAVSVITGVSVPIPRNLRFIANAERIVQRMFDKNFSKAFEAALRTAT